MHSIFGCVDLLLGGKKSPKSQFYGASGWLVRCGGVGESPLRGCTCLKCTNVLYGVEMVRC